MAAERRQRVGFFLWANDWLASERIALMTFAQEGLYVRMLTRASTGDGHLPADLGQLARLLGRPESEVRENWREPLVGCWSVADDGRLFNAKLVECLERDAEYREKKSEAGRRGAAARWQSHSDRSADATGKRGGKRRGKPMPSPSSSSSSSSSSQLSTQQEGSAEGGSAPSASPPPDSSKPSKGKPLWDGQFPEALCTDRFEALWANWIAYRREDLRKPVTQRSGDMSLKKLAAWGPARAIAAIEHTIANGWQGIREDDQKRKTPGDRSQRTWMDEELDRRAQAEQNGRDEPRTIDAKEIR